MKGINEEMISDITEINTSFSIVLAFYLKGVSEKITIVTNFVIEIHLLIK